MATIITTTTTTTQASGGIKTVTTTASGVGAGSYVAPTAAPVQKAVEPAAAKTAAPAAASGPAPAKMSAADRAKFLQEKYPKNIEEVTTEWISALMEKNVSKSTTIKVLEAGVTSDAAIFGLEYAAGTTGPASICLKYAKSNPENREFAQGAMMYEKETLFYQEIAPIVAKAGIPIPQVIGVFVDPDKPKEFFCIAMEDMGVEHDTMDQITGVSYEESVELAHLAAGLHATFWEHDLMKHPTVCNGNPKAANVFFQGWAELACTEPNTFDEYHAACLKEPVVTDMAPTADHETMVRLLKAHSPALFEEFHRILDSRPKTLCHGDMRSDNLFQRKDKQGFKVIDWQTYGAGPPAMEMHQLFGASMTKDSDYDRLPELLRSYLDKLHELNPASKSYTYANLWEDFQIVGVIGYMCLAKALGGVMAAMPPDAPNMKLFEVFFPRTLRVYNLLDIAGTVIRTAKKLKLKVDPKIPFKTSMSVGEKARHRFKLAAMEVLIMQRIAKGGTNAWSFTDLIKAAKKAK